MRKSRRLRLTRSNGFRINNPTVKTADLRNWQLSPLYAESLSGLPAALVLTAEYDALLDEGKDYADLLIESGVPTTYYSFPGQIHGFIELGGVFSATGVAIQMISDFLKEHL